MRLRGPTWCAGRLRGPTPCAGRLRGPTLAVTLAGVLSATALLSSSSHADEADRCIAAHHDAQSARRDGALRRARTALVACSEQRCPSLVRDDCARWLTDVERRLPTLLV